MSENLERIVGEALEDVFPYLARPGEVREIVESLVRETESMEEFVRSLKRKIEESREQTIRTDLRILMNRVQNIEQV